MTTGLSRYAASKDEIATALAEAKYDLPHGDIGSLSAPLHLVRGDLSLPELVWTTGTLVVIGSLTVQGQVDLQQSGKPIVNLVVTGNCELPLAYVDAFLCVGGNLTIGTMIADSNWGGGVFVAGNLTGHTLVVKDIGVEVDGTEHVERVADCDDPDAARVVVPALYDDHDEPNPRHLFAALRDSFGKTPPPSAAV